MRRRIYYLGNDRDKLEMRIVGKNTIEIKCTSSSSHYSNWIFNNMHRYVQNAVTTKRLGDQKRWTRDRAKGRRRSHLNINTQPNYFPYHVYIIIITFSWLLYDINEINMLNIKAINITFHILFKEDWAYFHLRFQFNYEWNLIQSNSNLIIFFYRTRLSLI